MSAKSVSTQPDDRIDRARIQKLAARFTETGDSPARVVASGVGFSPASISHTKSPLPTGNNTQGSSALIQEDVVENSNPATKKRKRGKSTSQSINAALIEHSDRYASYSVRRLRSNVSIL